MAKILIIDDDPDILEALQLTLEESGFQTKTCIRVENILFVIKDFEPDLILLDVLLSGEDGREVCKRLKTAELAKKIPVVMTSAHPEAKKFAIAAGADDFIAKPFDIFELLSLIKERT